MREIQDTEAQAGSAMPSIRNIAKSHKVSQALAQKAIELLVDADICRAEHGRGVFVRDSIQQPIQELLKETKTIAVVFGYAPHPETSHPFYKNVFNGFQEWLHSEEHDLLSFFAWRSKSASKKKQLIRRHAQHIDAFITIGIYNDDDLILLRNTGLPVCALDIDATTLGIHSVFMDNKQAIQLLTQSVLKERPKELIYIDFATETSVDGSAQERLDTFNAARTASRHLLKSQLCIAMNSFEDWHEEEKHQCKQMLTMIKNSISKPSIVIGDAALIPKIISYLQEHALHANDDYALAYVGDPTSEMELMHIPARVAAFDFKSVGAVGGQSLAQQFKSESSRAQAVCLSASIKQYPS